MAPKESSLNLSAGEMKMLIGIAKALGDVPDVDFEQVRKYTGHSYSKNARSVARKVFEKLRADGGNDVENGDDTAIDDDDAYGEENVTKGANVKQTVIKKAGKVVKKGIARPVSKKKAVATNPAGRPRTATRTRARTAAKMKAEENDENGVDEDEDEIEANSEDDSIIPDVKPKANTASDVLAEVQMTEEEQLEEDQYNANVRGMLLREWLEWKENNPYEASQLFYPPTPEMKMH